MTENRMFDTYVMIPCDQAVGIGRRANGVVVSIWDSLHMALHSLHSQNVSSKIGKDVFIY